MRIQRGWILLCFALLQLFISETGRPKSWSLSWKVQVLGVVSEVFKSMNVS